MLFPFLPAFFLSLFLYRSNVEIVITATKKNEENQAFNSISRDSCLMEDNKLTANRVILIMN